MKERVFCAFIYNCKTKDYECMMEWINPYFAKYMLKHIVHDMFYTVCEDGCEAKNLCAFVFYDRSIADVLKATNKKLSYLKMIMLDDVTVSCITKHDSYDYSQIYSDIRINNGKGYKFYRRMYVAK